jgi:hypothetical protein
MKYFILLVVALFTLPCVAAEVEKPQWIAVVAPEFKSELEPLVKQRTSDEFKVIVVTTTDILSSKQIREGDVEPLKQHIEKLCQQTKAKSSVLLAGAAIVKKGDDAEKTAVPTLRGTAGRMKNQPSDNAYGVVDKDLLPSVAVGRLPARNKAELRDMVQKILLYEQDKFSNDVNNQLTLIAGNPGGTSAIEQRFAETIVQNVTNTRLEKLHPLWTGRIIVHSSASPFFVANQKLQETSARYLQSGQFFSFYLGHSSANAFWSDSVEFMSRKDWEKLNIQNGAGVFFSCGCFGCQLSGSDGEGYGLAAIRNPNGPVAVIGAHGESYAAFGQFAIDGVLKCFSILNPPERLSEYWLATKQGIAREKMDDFTFMMYDQADGSRGTIPLDVQRREHLEMWMLLGDPAMRLPVAKNEIQLSTNDKATPGSRVKIVGKLPSENKSATVLLTLERPVGSTPSDLQKIPTDVKKASEVIMANHELANSLVIEAVELTVSDNQFKHELNLPAKLSWPSLVVRATTINKGDTKTAKARGAILLPVGK